jgi:hypothetical protein
LVVEAASRNDGEDGSDPAYFSQVRDWALVHAVHWKCARRALSENQEIKYGEEMARLTTLFQTALPQLRLVQGGESQ